MVKENFTNPRSRKLRENGEAKVRRAAKIERRRTAKKIDVTATAVVTEWVQEVAKDWLVFWAHRSDHRYRDPEAFLGERFLTDFGLRETFAEARQEGS